MKPTTDKSFAALFWENVRKTDDCWIWSRGCDYQGYGRFWVLGKSLRASRVAWDLANGPIPIGMVICHRCDNPPCVRPDHLFLGTPADNQRDMSEKLRGRIGERNGRAKITSEIAERIRHDYATGDWKQSALSHRYGLTQGHISSIIRGASWNQH